MPRAQITWQEKQGPGGIFHPSIDVIPWPKQARLSLLVMSQAWLAPVLQGRGRGGEQ